MIKIYSAENLPAAYLLQGILNGAGISTRIFNEYAQGGMGEIPFTHTYPEIWLEQPADRETALSLIHQFENQPSSAHNSPCPSCREVNPGNFETCWKCGTPLMEDDPKSPDSIE